MADSLELSRLQLRPEIEAARNAPEDNEIQKDLRAFDTLQRLESPTFVADGFPLLGETPEQSAAREKGVLTQQLRDYAQYKTQRGERLFSGLEIAQQREENAAYRADLPKLGALFSGAANMATAFPETERQGFEDSFKGSLRPDQEKMQAANMLLYERMSGNSPDAETWPVLRSQFAQQNFGASGPVSDDQLYGLAGKYFHEQQRQLDLSDKVANIGFNSALQALTLSDAVEKGKQAAGDDWPKFEPVLKASYANLHSRYSADTIKAANGVVQFLGKLQSANVEQGGQSTDLPLPEAYDRLSQTERFEALALAVESAQSQSYNIEGFLTRPLEALKTGSRNVTTPLSSYTFERRNSLIEGILKRGKVPEGTTDIFQDLDLVEQRSRGGVGEVTNLRPLTDEERQKAKEQQSFNSGAAKLLRDLSDQSPSIKRYRDDYLALRWNSIDDVLLMALESAPTMAVAAAPSGVGIGILAAGYGQRNLSRLEQAGATDSAGNRALATASGFLEAGIDKLEVMTLGARMPRLNAALLKWGKPGAVLVAGTRALTVGAAETVQEIGQDLTYAATQEVASALNQDIQGPDWGDVMKKEWESLGNIAGVSLVFGIVGGAGSTVSDYISSPKLKEALTDKRGLLLAGYSQQTVNEISERAESNPASAAELLKAAQISTSVEERKANSRAAVQRLMSDEVIQQTKDAGLPVPTLNNDGTVTLTAGDAEQTFQNMDEAQAFIREMDKDDEINLGQINQQMVEFLQSNEGESATVRFQPNLDSARISLDEWAGDNEKRRAVAYNRASIYLREAGIDMGVSDIDLAKFWILGSNRNEYADGLVTIVAQISKGANPLTILEERSEGFWKYVLDSNEVTQDKALGWLREIEAKTSRKLLADDFGTKSPELQRQDVVEALRQVTLASAVGRFEESQAPNALKKFFRAVKTVVGDLFSLASEVIGLRRNGQLNEDFDIYLRKAAGLDQMAEMEAARTSADAQIAETFSISLDGDPVLARIDSLARGSEATIDFYEKLAIQIRDINARQYRGPDITGDLASIDRQEEAAIQQSRQTLTSRYGNDLEDGKLKVSAFNTIQRQAEAEIRQKFEARREALRNRDESSVQRFEMQRDIAILEAIAKALPKEIRGTVVSGFRALSDLQTPAARESYLFDLLPRVDRAVEGYLQKTYRESIDKILEKGAVKVSEARTRGGKIGAVGHEVFDQAKEAMPLNPEAADALAESLREKIDAGVSMEQLEELDGRIAALEFFQDYKNADSQRLKDGLDLLTGVYQEGRAAWLQELQTRSELRKLRVSTILNGLRNGKGTFRADRNAGRSQNQTLLGKINEGILGASLSGSQTFRRLAELTDDVALKDVVEQMEGDFLNAELGEQDMNRIDNESLAQAMRDIFGAKSVYSVSKRLSELSQLTTTTVETLEGRSVSEISVPKNIVQELIDSDSSSFEVRGETITLSDADKTALAASWEEFQQLPETSQGRRRNVRFDRVNSEGERRTLGTISKLDALQLWLTMRQPDQFTKLEKMGYDEQTLAQLEAWLPEDAKALGLWMVDYIGQDAFNVDSIHRLEKGVALKLVNNYFPVRNDVARAMDGGISLDGNAPQATGKSASFVKQRVSNNAEPAFVNALAVFLANRAQVNFWKSHITPLREWGGVIRDEQLATGVRSTMGDDYYRALELRLKRIESAGRLNATQALGLESLARTLQKNFALGTLGGRISTILVNLTAGLNIGLEVPITELAKGARDLIQRPEALKDAWNSPAIQRRFKEGATTETRTARSQGPSTHPVLATLNDWAEKGLAPINWADTGAQLAGASIAWEYTRKQGLASGLTEDQARAEANAKVERIFLRAAQPTTRLAKSEFELRLMEQPVGSLGVMFFSEPRKTLSILYLAARELLTGKGFNGKGLAAQQIVVAGFFMVGAEYLIRTFYQSLARAKDDEDEDFGKRFTDRLTDPKALGYAFTTNHLKSIPVAGDIYSHYLASAFDQKSYDSQNFIAATFQKAGRSISKLQEAESREDTLDGAIALTQSIGSVIPGGSLFSQVANATEFVEGVMASNGVAVSDDERAIRTVAKYRKFNRELQKALGPDKAENGKIDKAKKATKDAARVNQLNLLLEPLTPEMRDKVKEKLKISQKVEDQLDS